MAKQEISNYSAKVFRSSTEMSTVLERGKDPYDSAVFKLSDFSFKSQMSHEPEDEQNHENVVLIHLVHATHLFP